MTQKSEFRLCVENVTKLFPGTKALDDVSLQVKPGQVLALVGENGAGKSTLMNIIGGVYKQTSGTVYIDGEPCDFSNPLDAQRSGIGFVHQELSVFPHLSVAYNIFIDRMPKTKWGFIDKKTLNRMADEVLSSFENDMSARRSVASLSVANRQMVEIARAISLDCKLMIFDEPTSSLTQKETESLFRIIHKLKQDGVSVIYITHRLSEVFEICDSVAVLKDGKMVDVLNIADVNVDMVVSRMIGRDLDAFYPPKSTHITQDVILRIKNMTGRKRYHDISFDVHRGEVVGLYGLLGAGRSELMCAVCAIDPHVSGHVELNGETLQIKNYAQALKKGMMYLTEDRKQAGIFPILSVKQNLLISQMCKDGGVWFSQKGETQIAEQNVVEHDIKTASVDTQIQFLSGGNQQKVLIARGLRCLPKVIVLDEPTRGIDVNAKAEIHKKIRALAQSGIGVVIISSEMPEIIGMADTVVVMYEGTCSGTLYGAEVTEANIIALAAGAKA